MSRRHSELLLTVLSIVLLTSACATTAAKKTPSATPGLTPPALSIKPARPLVWIAHQLPFAVPLGRIYNTGLFFSQADGATAYACVETGQNVRVWVTRDKAVHWIHSADVPGAADSCRVTVDDAYPETAILLTYHAIDDHCQACNHGDYRNYLTRDAGATWTPLVAPSPETPLYGLLKTHGSVTYATAATIPHSHCGDCHTTLYASKDDMRTWAPMDNDILAAGRFAYVFWLNDVGEILAATTNRGAGQDELWLTTDQGAHWKAWSVTHADSFLVPEGQRQRFWRACGVTSSMSSNAPPNSPGLTCTLDGGATWTPSGGSGGTIATLESSAQFMTPDGAALRANYVGSSSGWDAEITGEVQRAIPDKQGWESLGTLPASGTLALSTGGQTSILWLLKRPTNDGVALTTIYIATYP
jgi:hypothetical protein